MSDTNEREGLPKLGYGRFRDKLEPDDTDGKTAVLTIETAEARNMAPSGQAEEFKLCITFVEIRDSGGDGGKEMVLNATDYRRLVAEYGTEDERRWVGKLIVVSPTQTTFRGKQFEKMHVAVADRWSKAMKAHEARKGSR